jgi:hypothetical protein
MPDCFLSDTGDLQISTTGDIAITETTWRDYGQQAYIIMMTPITDFTLYPNLGTELESIIGMPQTEETGNYGCELIKAALSRDGKFSGIPVAVKAIPTSLQAIRFDIYVTVGSRSGLILSLEQDLGIR